MSVNKKLGDFSKIILQSCFQSTGNKYKIRQPECHFWRFFDFIKLQYTYYWFGSNWRNKLILGKGLYTKEINMSAAC